MATKTPRQRLEQLVKTFERISRESSDAALELQAILDTKPTNGQQAKHLLDAFVETWQNKYRAKYVVNGAKDMATFKRLLKTIDPLEVKTRMLGYFNDTDPFVVEARHPIGLFASRINKLGPVKPAPVASRVVNCKHQPPCSSDAAHTRRSMSEQRDRA